MGVLDFFALLVLCVLVAAAIVIAIVLAALPGKIAKTRNHPQAEAIKMCGWMGLITFVMWPIAFVWAYTQPLTTPSVDPSWKGAGASDIEGQIKRLQDQIRELEEALSRTTETQGGAQS